MTRAGHLQWCKDRALEYVTKGDNPSALSSMLSDLGKHPETQSAVESCGSLGTMMLISGHLNEPHQMREFINGFN